MLKGGRRWVLASDPCSIRGQIDGQKAREMQAWWLTQPGGNEKVSKIWDTVSSSTTDDCLVRTKVCKSCKSSSPECYLVVHHIVLKP